MFVCCWFLLSCYQKWNPKESVNILWLKLYREGSYQTLTKLSVNYYKNNIYVLALGRTRRDGCHPASEVFLSFFLVDKTSVSDISSSCSFIPHAHFETSLVIVSYYGYDRSTSVVRVQTKTWQTFLTNSQRYIWAIIHWWVTPHLFFALGGKRVAGSSLFATYIEPGIEGRKLHLKICSQNTLLESSGC